MKILIVAGGGGHFSPALAVINKFPAEWEILVIGRKYTFEGENTLSFEYQTARKLGIPFETINTGRLQRKFTRHTLVSLFKLPIGFFQAFSLIKKFKPDIILSFGGYVSVPVVLVANQLHIPVVLHEQTLGAGMANKLAAKFAEKVCISWEQSKKYFPKGKIVLTGNPLRVEFLNRDKTPLDMNKNIPTIYITGGSSGSHAFNCLIEGCLEKLLLKYNLIHQTGDSKQFNDFDRLQQRKESLPEGLQKRYFITKFIEPKKVVDYLNFADLIISRSGINTVTELLFLGKPCLLIPLPYGQHDEQLENALFVKSTGLAEVLSQNLLTPDNLYTSISKIMENLDIYRKHAEATRKLIDLDAGKKIIEVLINENKKKNN